jgi:hypothetical protein
MTDEREMSPEEKTGLVQLEWFLRFGNAPNASELIDAYRSAVRAETLREVREVVDNLTHSRAHPQDYYYTLSICDHSERDGRGGYDVYVERTDLLTALDALAHPEGTDK